jgi:hypothetical protein
VHAKDATGRDDVATATEDMRHVLWRRDDLDPDFDPDSVGPDRPLEYTLACDA